VSADMRHVARGVALLATVFLASCSWFTDFKQQPKIDPWETPSDTIAFRGNPQGSVPTVGSVAPGFEYDRMPAPQAIATMASIPNPVPADSASVSRGRINFQINCAVCHGPLGMGNGNATKYGMPGIGIGAGSNAANTLTDGYIFGMIRNGRGLMPSYNRIEERDRWDVVNYLRSIQGKGTVAADTSHGRPGETGTSVPGATPMGPTRPSPYFHAGTNAAATDTARRTTPDTTKKPERQP
jgi:mono/diheme cytochrome c family protein